MYGPKSGGLKTTVNEISRRYAEIGNEVLVIIPDKESQLTGSPNLTFHRLQSPVIPYSGGYRVITKVRKVISLLDDFAPDVIEISDRSTLLIVAAWAKRKGIPTTFFAHERLDEVLHSFFPLLPGQKVISKLWNRLTNITFTNIVATTKYASKEFLDISSKKLEVIPLGVDLNTFQPKVVGKSNSHSDEKYLISCTRLSKEKDPFFLIELARELKSANIDTPILVFGTGPLFGKLTAIAKQEKLNIDFLGYINDKNYLAQKIAGADAYLAPGPIETFGLAALEALACGVPVLCSNKAAISEIIDFESGVALPRDTKQWLEAIDHFQKLHRDYLRQVTRRRAEKFNWDITIKSLMAIHGFEITKAG